MKFYILICFMLINTFHLVISQIPNVWPLPQNVKVGPSFFKLNPQHFQFIKKNSSIKSDIIDEALERYKKLMFVKDCSLINSSYSNEYSEKSFFSNEVTYSGVLSNITIEVRDTSKRYPYPEMNEMYTIRIDTDDLKGQGLIFAEEVWGLLRGLETLSQLVYIKDENFMLNSTFILDYPRFTFRGLLLDTSRHFIPLKYILKNLDAMAYNKMNVFHWHIVDDQSFPYFSKRFPSLSEKGAFLKTHQYSPNDVETVIDYARKRGIRVMVEFDTPGHTLSWGKSQPQLLTKCYKDGKIVEGSFGPLDPTNQFTYQFLEDLFQEISQVFPEKYIHLGGDEVSFYCWESNPFIKEFMYKHGIQNYTGLENYYIQKLIKIVENLNKNYVVWQEVYDNGVAINKETIVHVWKGENNPSIYFEKLAQVTEDGYRAILSSAWYLNYISYGSDWKSYYEIDPYNFNGTYKQKALVIGGEACMWGEYVDATNLISRTWPRTSAVAERLWSNKNIIDIKDATQRIKKHRCRMLQRGLRVEPIDGPDYCYCDFAL